MPKYPSYKFKPQIESRPALTAHDIRINQGIQRAENYLRAETQVYEEEIKEYSKKGYDAGIFDSGTMETGVTVSWTDPRNGKYYSHDFYIDAHPNWEGVSENLADHGYTDDEIQTIEENYELEDELTNNRYAYAMVSALEDFEQMSLDEIEGDEITED